jgi:hypothetical protein
MTKHTAASPASSSLTTTTIVDPTTAASPPPPPPPPLPPPHLHQHMPQPCQRKCPHPCPQQQELPNGPNDDCVVWAYSKFFFVFFLVFLNQLNIFLQFLGYTNDGCQCKMKPPPPPIEMGCEAVDMGKEGAEGQQETPGGGYLRGMHPMHPVTRHITAHATHPRCNRTDSDTPHDP